MRRVPNPQEIREALGLTQRQFARQFEIALGTLRDWEQGVRLPDSAARAYLRVIQQNPAAVLKALLPALFRAARPTCEDADPQTELRDRLRARVRRTWGAARAWSLLPIAVLLLAGCGRTVYVPEGAPVRLRETVRDAKVWVMGKDGAPVAGEMDIPEGWYCLPDEPPEE